MTKDLISHIQVALVLLISTGSVLSNSGAPVEIRLPAEIAAFKQDAGAEIANAHCLTCHSVEYVTIQPPLPRTFWKGSIQKMQQKYGAAIPDNEIEPLADYLTRNYGAATNHSPKVAPNHALQNSREAASPNAAPDVSQLAAKYGCSSCHNPSLKLVGPSLRDIAAKYKTDPSASAKIEQQIHTGGSGKWGTVIMPPFPQASAAETKILADWVLSSGGTK
jgi:sulfite dehydrogenase